MKEENSCEKDSFKVLVNPVLKNKNEQHGTPVRESQVEPVFKERTRNNGQAGPPDDVDGLVQDVLVPISKMVFLKIIFIDIGITAGIQNSQKLIIFLPVKRNVHHCMNKKSCFFKKICFNLIFFLPYQFYL